MIRLRALRFLYSILAVALDSYVNDLKQSPVVQDMIGNNGETEPIKLRALSFAFILTALAILYVYARIEMYKRSEHTLNKKKVQDLGYSMKTVRWGSILCVGICLVVVLRLFVSNDKLRRKIFKGLSTFSTDIFIPGMMMLKSRKIAQFTMRRLHGLKTTFEEMIKA